MLPAVPKAQDLPSALQAIQALTQIVMILSGQPPPQNNVAAQQRVVQGTPVLRFFLPGPSGSAGPPGVGGSRRSNWVEAFRTTATVRVENPDDSSQFVEIERINQLVMRDTVTGSTWEFNR
jgi:hypothetical protein